MAGDSLLRGWFRWCAERRDDLRALVRRLTGRAQPPAPPQRGRVAAIPLPPRDVYLVRPAGPPTLMPAPPRLPGGRRRRLPYGDFRDPAECDHFAALPPIERGDLGGVDWDALARELTRGA